MVALLPSPRSWIYAAVGSPAGSAGASKTYSLARLGLALSANLGCLCSLTTLPLPAAVPRCGIGGAVGPVGPVRLVIYLSPPLSPLTSVYRVVGEVSVPSLPPSAPPRHSVSLGGHSGGFVPPWQLFHSRGINAPWKLNSPHHSLAPPPPPP